MSEPLERKAKSADADHEAASAAEVEAEAEAAAGAVAEDRAGAGAEAAARLDSIDALRAAGDVEGLIRLARAHRSGTAGLARELPRCFEAYRAASDLGSAVASHALGLFYLHGGPVAPDEMEAAKRFRAAADAGHLASKVVIANFYECGIHYRADPAKGDVWYRNVARAAGIEDEPTTPAFDQAMAELGCVRHVLAVIALSDTGAADRTRLLRIAKIHGHREGRASITTQLTTQLTEEELAEEQIAALERLTGAPAPVATGVSRVRAPDPGATATDSVADPARVSTSDATAKALDKDKETRASRLPKPPKAQVGLGLTAFFFSLVCAGVAVVAGHVAPPFLVDRGLPIPVLGMRFDLVLPVALLAVGALPNLLVYRLSAWLRAMLLGGAAGVAGEVLWGVGQRFVATRMMQISDLVVAGFLAGLLVFGIFGGAKPGSR